MIFDEFSMFDFKGFFLSRLIVCDLNMPHDCLFNTISSCLCCLQFSQDKCQPNLVHV